MVIDEMREREVKKKAYCDWFEREVEESDKGVGPMPNFNLRTIEESGKRLTFSPKLRYVNIKFYLYFGIFYIDLFCS